MVEFWCILTAELITSAGGLDVRSGRERGETTAGFGLDHWKDEGKRW